MKFSYFFLLFIAFSLTAPLLSRADVHIVELRDFVFYPDTITINEGDTIIWLGVDDFHNVVSGSAPIDNGVFRSDIMFRNNSYSFTFYREVLVENPLLNGTFNYFCEPHYDQGMIGVVNVTRLPKSLIATPVAWQEDSTATDTDSLSCTLTANAPETDLTISCVPDGGFTLTSLKLHSGALGTSGDATCDLGASASGNCTVNSEVVTELLNGQMYLRAQTNTGKTLRGQITKAGGSSSVFGAVKKNKILPIPGASLSDGTRTAVTDTNGRFTLSNVPNGVYRLAASAEDLVLNPDTGVSPFIVNGGDVINRNFSVAVQTSPTTRNDFDGDGIPDPAIFKKGKITALFSTTKKVGEVATIDKAPLLFGGVFYRSGKSDIAAVSKSTSDLNWRLINSVTGEAQTITFGSASAKPLSGCDINGDGVTDLAYRSGNTVTYTTDFGTTTQSVTLPITSKIPIACISVQKEKTGFATTKVSGRKSIVSIYNEAADLLSRTTLNSTGTLVPIDKNRDGVFEAALIVSGQGKTSLATKKGLKQLGTFSTQAITSNVTGTGEPLSYFLGDSSRVYQFSGKTLRAKETKLSGTSLVH